MNTIIILSNYTTLKKFLETDGREYSYIIIDTDCIDIQNLFMQERYKKINIREGIDDLRFRNEYIDFIGTLNRHYNSINWWVNSISYKGILISNLYQQIYDYRCIVSFLNKYSPNGNYIIVSSSPILNANIKKYCEEHKICCKVLDVYEKKNNIIHLRRCCSSALYFLSYGWLRKILIWVCLSKKIKKVVKFNKSYYVVKSWAENRSFSNDGRFTDLYFGKLGEYLQSEGKDFVILVGILNDYNDYKNIILKLRNVQGTIIIPQEYFVGYLDYLKVIIMSFVKRPRIKQLIKFANLDVTDFLTESFRKDYENNEVSKNLIYYYYVKSLIKKIKINTFVFTFENQAWEKMSVFALRKYSPQTKIIGYIHSSITQFQLSYFYGRAEREIIPLPDKIITTGKEPKLILESISGAYVDKVQLSEGCTLRFGHLFDMQRIERNNNENILVAFSVYMRYSMELLKFLCAALKEKKEYKVVLRSHPLMPLELIVKKWNIRINDNFSISRNIRLDDDLREAAILIYVDTTASVEALMRGIPTIRIDLKEPTSLDPLFKLNNLKWTVCDKDELVKAIDYIFSMDEQEYLKKYRETADYIRRYFYPPEERYLKEFIT